MADKSAHKAKTRARILDEAANAIRASGAQGISVAELMKRAGLTHGGFYAHFSSRDDLVAHAIDRMFEDSALMVSRYLGDEPDLTAFIDYYLSEGNYRRVERGCPMPGLSGEVGRMPPAARERFEQGVHAFRNGIAHVLAAQGREDSEALASSVMAELVGAMTLARTLSDDAAALAALESSRRLIKDRIGLG